MLKKIFISCLIFTSLLLALSCFGVSPSKILGKYASNNKPMVLLLDFKSSFYEASGNDSVSPFSTKDSLYDFIHAIDLAANDPRIKGVVAKLDEAKIGMAQCQEIRDALMRFRSSNNKDAKFSYAFADTFGEAKSGLVPYFLATSFDQIWLQPAGIMAITGLATEVPFFKKMLDEIGIEPQVIKKGEFKSFLESFTEEDFSPHAREATMNIINSLSNLIIREIAISRELTESEVQENIDDAPLLATDALKRGLIDHLGYWSDLLQTINEQVEDEVLYITPQKYIEDKQDDIKKNAPKFALISIEGNIERTSNPASMNNKAVANKIEPILRSISKNPEIKAVIIRINSPGGSAVASETIWHAVHKIKQSGTPVIVTMGDYAASGGYWIATAASKIVAHPSTITGSIGVISGKMLTKAFWENIGVNWKTISEGQNADMWSNTVPYNSESREKMEKISAHLYNLFIQKVSQGRSLSAEHVKQVAKGRAWCGEDALRYGLVDQMGGFKEAIELAQRETGLQNQEVSIVSFPEPKSKFEKYLNILEPESIQQAIAGAITVAIKTFTHTVLNVFHSQGELTGVHR